MRDTCPQCQKLGMPVIDSTSRADARCCQECSFVEELSSARLIPPTEPPPDLPAANHLVYDPKLYGHYQPTT